MGGGASKEEEEGVGGVLAEVGQWQLGWVGAEKRLGEGGAFLELAEGDGACGIGRGVGRGWEWW